MYKTINIIIPYFGEFPNYFQLFLNSCAKNPTIDWTIISDNTRDYNYPPNVKKVFMAFNELQYLVCNKFDFMPTIHAPYKLCDYKPAYGYLFDNLVEGYDFWGHGDMDLIYGDLRHFLTEEVMSYDKIFTLGHLSLFRNTTEINSLFKEKLNGIEVYKEVFTSEKSFNFDEEFLDKPNINAIFKEQGLKVWDKSYAADIYTKSNHFIIDLKDGKTESRKDAFFFWNDGKLERYVKTGSEVEKEEYMYIHLQKRKMDIAKDLILDRYKIIPNRFEALEVDLDSIEDCFNRIRKQTLNNQYLRIRSKNLKVKMMRCWNDLKDKC